MASTPVHFFRAYNFDPSAKAEAQELAKKLSSIEGTRRTYRVEYRDHYDDTRIAGDYVVVLVD